MSETTEFPVYVMPGGHTVSVYLHGLIKRPYDGPIEPLVGEELALFLRVNLGHRIRVGRWGSA